METPNISNQQPVEAPYDFMTPPAVRPEDRTQPMGPLEQGDQALVDAARQVPAGEHVLEHDDGSRTRVHKNESLTQDIVVAETTTPDGATESVGTLVNSSPGRMGNISARITEYPVGYRGGKEVAQVSGNEVGDILNPQYDRQKAQAIKLEAAGKINKAAERLAEGYVQDPDLARDMAESEDPARTRITERNKDVAMAKEAADQATKDYVNNESGERYVSPAELEAKVRQHTMTRGAVAGPNQQDLELANQASEAVRQQHEQQQG